MGWWTPPPPVWVGARQPFAPPLGLPQSGPVPQAPPLRGALQAQNLQILLNAWTPAYFFAQGAGDIAAVLPISTAPSQPPPISRVPQAIYAKWNEGYSLSITMPSAAGNVSVTPDQPPPTSSTNLYLLTRSWQPPTFYPQSSARIAPNLPAPPAPSQPPVPSRTAMFITLRYWEPTFTRVQGYGASAVIPSLPPPVGSTPGTVLPYEFGYDFNMRI